MGPKPIMISQSSVNFAISCAQISQTEKSEVEFFTYCNIFFQSDLKNTQQLQDNEVVKRCLSWAQLWDVFSLYTCQVAYSIVLHLIVVSKTWLYHIIFSIHYFSGSKRSPDTIKAYLVCYVHINTHVTHKSKFLKYIIHIRSYHENI